MSKYCVVCRSNKDSALIRFPEKGEQRDIWIENTNVTPQIANSDKSRICLIHFDDDQWEERLSKTNRQFRALKRDAVPTLYLRENAPVAPNLIPHQGSKIGKSIRCSLCNSQVQVVQAVAIFDKHDAYTDFGAALAFILKLASKPLASRYCCVDCSEEAFACFGAIININVSAILTARLNEMHQADSARLLDAYQKKREAGDDTPVDIKLDMRTMSDIKTSGLLGNRHVCESNQCGKSISTLHEFTDHMTNHFFERKSAFMKAVAITQTDEMEIDLAESLNFDEINFGPVVTPTRKKIRAKKVAEDEPPVFSLDHLEIKHEHSDAIEFGLQDELIEERLEEEEFADDPLIEEHLLEDDDEELVEERLLSETENENDEWTPDMAEGEDPPPVKKVRRTEKKTKNSETGGGGMCQLCGRILKSNASLKMHMKQHMDPDNRVTDTGGPQECSICGVMLKHFTSLKQHLMRVHSTSNNNAKVCDICGQVRGNLTQHKKTCAAAIEKGRKTSSSTCGVCGKIYASRYMSKHLKLHTMEEDIAKNGRSVVEKYFVNCEICGKRTTNLPIHNSKHHRELLKEGTGELDPDTSKHDCRHCGATFEQRPLLVAHLVLKHGLNPKTLPKRGRQGIRTNWKCSVCQVTFKTYCRIKRHTQAEHNGMGIDLNCELCGKRYNTIEALREHINVKHIAYYQYNCYPCDKHFVNEETYQKHLTYFCRVNGVMRRRGGRMPRVEEDSKQYVKFEMDEYDDADGLPLVDINGVVTEELEEDGEGADDVDDISIEPVYLPQEGMLVVYEESVPYGNIAHEG